MFNTPTTGYEWRFRLFGISVEVQPFFWLIGLLFLGQPAYQYTTLLNGVGPEQANPLVTMLVVLVFFFLSILIHELGHVFAFRYYGIDSRVLLHGFGGLAIPTGSYGGRRKSSRWQEIVISAGGPFLQAVFVAVLLGMCFLFFNGVTIERSLQFIRPTPFTLNTAGINWFVVFYLSIMANVFWIIFNLLPILPMDGGHISAGICKDIYGTHQGRVYALWISVFTGALLAVLAFQNKMMLAAFYIAYMAFQSFQELQQHNRW